MLDNSACYSYEELDSYMSARVHTKVNKKEGKTN